MEQNIQTNYFLKRVGAVKLREESLVVDIQFMNKQFLVELRSYYRKRNGKVCWVTESQHWVSFSILPIEYMYEEQENVSVQYGIIERERLQYISLNKDSRELIQQTFPQFNFQNILYRKECTSVEIIE